MCIIGTGHYLKITKGLASSSPHLFAQIIHSSLHPYLSSPLKEKHSGTEVSLVTSDSVESL